MIQVNILIEACKQANVQVLTPTFTYDFADPAPGITHAKIFRQKCEMAADYISGYIIGRLAGARKRLLQNGLWSGARMPSGSK
jgi:hypothetical protein